MATAQPASDGDVIAAVRGGDKEAYREIVERYMRKAYGVAVGLVGNTQDAMDLSQMAFIAAFRHLKEFDTARPFFPWFYAILKNICLDHLKHARRLREVPLVGLEIADDNAADHGMRRAVERAIAGLPVEQREVITLRYLEDMTYREIAQVLGKPIGTVMSSLYYAKKRLRDRMREFLGSNA